MISRHFTSAPENGLNQPDSDSTCMQLSLRLITKSEVNQQTDEVLTTVKDNEKRSQTQKNTGGSNAKRVFSKGVGGRQATSPLSPGGGGYLNICNTLMPLSDPDPRLDTLRRMGLHHTWQRVAAAIGVDAFLEMWRILDGEEQFAHEGDGLRLSLRRYRSFLRQERDCFVVTLARAGLSAKEIQRRLDKQLGESLSIDRIRSILGAKIAR